MAIEKTEQSRDRTEQASGGEQARPDTALAVWMSWMEIQLRPCPELDGQRRALVADGGRTILPATCWRPGASQLSDILGRDPLLRSIDQMWNANPMREIVPVDWAEIARALRTVWMLSLARPGREPASGGPDLNTRLWQSAIDNWKN